MKKLLMMATLATSISLVACAQKLDASKVPAGVKAAFTKQYPGVTAKWEKEDGKYEASFKQGGMICRPCLNPTVLLPKVK